jgi:YD repeat-containing protein
MKSWLNLLKRMMPRALSLNEGKPGISFLATKTFKIILALILSFCFQNQISAAEQLTKPNEPGPWPGLEVNTYTGNFFCQRNDLFIPARGALSFDITFTYNSLKYQTDKGYGNGWSFSFGMHYSYSGNNFTVYREDGQEDVFTWNGSVFIPPVGVYDVLVEYASGEYLLTTKYGMKYYFENAILKNLTKSVDRNGNTITLIYSGNELVTITDPAGRVLNLNWDNGHLMQITDPNTTPSRLIEFDYDGSWNMIQVTRPLSNTWLYGYSVDGLMNSVTDPRGNIVTVLYDENEAVASISCAPVNYTKSFAYDNCDNTTTVSQVVSTVNRQTVYTFDLAGRVIDKQFPDGNDVSYTWDIQNNITIYTDENGNTTTYTWDSKANMLSMTDCSGNSEYYAYESNYNNVLSNTNKKGDVTTYSYDGSGNLTGITDCLTNQEFFSHDSYGQVISSTDKNSFITTYSYDIYGNQTGLTDPLGFSKTNTFDGVGNMLTSTDKRGFTTTYSNDLFNRVTSILDALGYTISYIYDPNGNLTGETNQNSYTTTYTYDQLNRRIGKTDAGGGVTSYTYDEASKILTETNANEAVTTYTYTIRDWVAGITDCLGYTESYTYGSNGLVLSHTDKSGNTTNYAYDCLGQLTLITDPNGFSESDSYDAAGNRISYTNKNGITTTYDYDCRNLNIATNYPLGYSEYTTYDPEGNMIWYTDKNGNTTIFNYDALGRLTEEADPLLFSRTFILDGEGNITGSTDKNGNTSTYTYDGLGRMSGKTDPPPFGYNETYTRDGVGNLLTVTDRRGNTTTYTYNGHNQRTSMTTPLGFTESSTFDFMENRTSHTDKNGYTTSFTYDCMNQHTSTTDPLGFTESFTYNPDGKMISHTDKNGGTKTWIYSCCRLLSETDELGFTESYGYDAVWNRTSVTNKNGDVTNYLFDLLGRLMTITTPLGNQTQMTLDGVGNIVSKTDANLNTITYTYNARNELITTLYPDATAINYSYDDNGKLTQTSNTGGIGDIMTYSYDNLGRLTLKVTDFGPFSKSIAYTYDENGNNVSITAETGTIFYEYDADNRVTQITDQNGGVTTFEYDGVGNQTAMYYPNGVVTLTTYDALGRVLSVITRDNIPPPLSPIKTVMAVPGNTGRLLFNIDCGITEMLQPVSGPLSDHEQVTIVVMNYGIDTAFDVVASYMIPDVTYASETISTPIPPMDSLTYTFTQTADLSHPGQTYQISTCVMVTGDENPYNDCLISTVTNESGGGGGGIYQSFTYSNNPNGLKTFEVHEDGSNISYTYNLRNELLSETNSSTGDTNQYTYTNNGQRASKTVNGVITPYMYSLDGVLMHVGENVMYMSDNNGNRIEMINTEDTTQTFYTYDYENELVSSEWDDGLIWACYYSASGTQLKKIENGVTTYVHSIGGEPLEEFDTAGMPVDYMNLTTSRQTEFFQYSIISLSDIDNTYYLYYNGSGSTTLQMDSAKTVIATADFDIFGNFVPQGMWIDNMVIFHGMEWESDVQLYESGTVIYDPELWWAEYSINYRFQVKNSNPKYSVSFYYDPEAANILNLNHIDLNSYTRSNANINTGKKCSLVNCWLYSEANCPTPFCKLVGINVPHRCVDADILECDPSVPGSPNGGCTGLDIIYNELYTYQVNTINLSGNYYYSWGKYWTCVGEIALFEIYAAGCIVAAPAVAAACATSCAVVGPACGVCIVAAGAGGVALCESAINAFNRAKNDDCFP